ncbi:MAG: hypothetical protein ACTJFS_01425 [Micrococcaceae bacterium]|uniref:hypothetical protein n=1 Tax=Brachybacterium alimentarium TaxID=47845 RepID=UPI003FCF98C5
MYRDGDKVYMTKTELEGYRQEQRFQRSMQQAQHDMTTGPGNQVARDLGTTTAVGAGMVASKRFRYIIQVPLHFIMGYFVCLIGFIMLAAYGIIEMDGALEPLAYPFFASLVWTGIYVALRTIPKWRALNN